MAMATTLLVGILGIGILVSALWVVTLRNLFRAALSLGVVLVGVAGLFLLLDAAFLAFVQILVYVGAILTLIVFAIMLTAKRQASVDAPPFRQRLPAAVVSIALFGLLEWATQSLVWPEQFSDHTISAAELGGQFVTQLVLPFELISLVFVAAMVGSIAITAVRRRAS